MLLSPPFMISSRLLPAVRVGDATLSLDTDFCEWTTEGRQVASFILDVAGKELVNSSLRSGVGGFRGLVEQFESFLSFLDHAVEESKHADNEFANDPPMFTPEWLSWAIENQSEIQLTQCDMCDENGSAIVNLINDEQS